MIVTLLQSPLQRMVEDINDQASDFTANSVAMSSQTLSRLEDINTRWKLLQLGLDEQYKKLNEVPTVYICISGVSHYIVTLMKKIYNELSKARVSSLSDSEQKLR